MPAPSFRLLPIVVLAGSLAIGVHAGEAAKTLTAAAKPASAKPTDSPAVPASRAALDLAREATAPPPRSDDRERQLKLREQLLAVSEQRVNAKLAELKALQSKPAEAPPAQRAANAPLMSVVKIYETMKPKDAARIFEKLDLNVQLAVAANMKERAMSALLAQMSPDNARRLTMELVAKAGLSDTPRGQAGPGAN